MECKVVFHILGRFGVVIFNLSIKKAPTSKVVSKVRIIPVGV